MATKSVKLIKYKNLILNIIYEDDCYYDLEDFEGNVYSCSKSCCKMPNRKELAKYGVLFALYKSNS